MRLLSILVLFFCLSSCQSGKPKAFYEIATGEEFRFQVVSFKGKPYYWEWANQEKVTYVKLTSRVYFNTIFSTEERPRGKEIWTFEGTKPGTDTLKLHLRSYEEDSLNTPVADSLIIIVKVNEKTGL